ncbi:uncharacterized protein [Physcomitrium patens]|uniref:Tify domain-containing protein n=1 Tax=Physcomitrium patens TaxID=3218 RepID=A0A2K1K2U6_PHYPA|nr:uncharacterized protein LOC112286242 [Physcomitrium patens]PNR48098.1 hypothetical protein PHYPA_012571 [Physcomitrium patens]|eukprot:XP_024383719.1 uncharacterized protein LOC112286242 [Physcomitrella patens]
MSLMKGDGDESGDRDLLSLGSTSRSTSSSQGEVFPTKQASAGVEDESMYLTMLCSLSRNGLNMLAGGANGGFSLKSPAIGNLDVTPGISGLRNLSLGAGSERTSTVSGGGFTEFYRSSVPKIRSSLSETGLRSVSDDIKVNGEGRESPSHREEIGRISGKVGFPLKSDVTNLSTDACWRLILKLGMRWPAWNGTTASLANQEVIKDKENENEEQGGKPETLHQGQNSLRLLASRALEALAQAPSDHYGRRAGDMLAPKQKSQAILETKAAENASHLPKSVQQSLIASKQSTLVAKASTMSREMLAPKSTFNESRTASLTIFYDGTVNVTDNVPADKARLIMLIAENSGTTHNTKALKNVAPISRPLSQVRPILVPTSPSKVDPSQYLPQSKPFSVPSDQAPSANRIEGSTFDQGPAEDSNPAKTASAEQPPVPLTLPNARKNSLARFLDSRKRSRGQCSEGTLAKKPVSSQGRSSNAKDLKGGGKSPMPDLCRNIPLEKEGPSTMLAKAADKISTDVEMKESLAK